MTIQGRPRLGILVSLYRCSELGTRPRLRITADNYYINFEGAKVTYRPSESNNGKSS